MLVPAAQNTAVATWSPEQISLLKRTICSGATDDELKLFLHVCERTQLDPFAKQIYAVKRWDSKARKETMAFQTGIDGMRLVAQRSGQYEGQTAPQWCGKDGIWKDVWLANEFPSAARVGVWRKGFKEPVWGIAKWTEYCQKNKEGHPTYMWQQMPCNQLSKCAESLALRRSFPQELSGLYTTEEMSQATEPEKQEPATIAPMGLEIHEPEGKPTTRVSNLNQRLARPVAPKAVNSVPETPQKGGISVPLTPPKVAISEFIIPSKVETPIVNDLGEFVINLGSHYLGKKLKEVDKDVLFSAAVQYKAKLPEVPSHRKAEYEELIYAIEAYLGATS